MARDFFAVRLDQSQLVAPALSLSAALGTVNGALTTDMAFLFDANAAVPITRNAMLNALEQFKAVILDLPTFPGEL